MKTHAATSAGELIWQGRIHLGDEPGVYGDANYGGLAVELPVTLTANNPTDTAGRLVFELTAEDVTIYGGYPGHLVIISVFDLVPSTSPPQWARTQIATGRLTGNTVTVAAPLNAGQRYVSVRLEADTTVTPGFYDDFILKRLALQSATHYADFGFRG